MARQRRETDTALPHLVIFATDPEFIDLCRRAQSLHAVYRVWMIQRLTERRITLLAHLLMHFFQGQTEDKRVWFIRDRQYPEERLNELMRQLYELTSGVLPRISVIHHSHRDTPASLFRKIQMLVQAVTSRRHNRTSLIA